MNFYEFSQNNSGGSFIVDSKVTHWVFIQANSAEQANQLAEELGIYFDGCSYDRDCECCGDRWYPAYDYDIVKFPLKYDNELTFQDLPEYCTYLAKQYGWIDKERGPEARIYYLDGSVTEIFKP